MAIAVPVHSFSAHDLHFGRGIDDEAGKAQLPAFAGGDEDVGSDLRAFLLRNVVRHLVGGRYDRAGTVFEHFSNNEALFPCAEILTFSEAND
jgi:hypothetical protein